MLVLSRRKNQKIVIGGGITITILRTDRRCVRVGIDAPADISVVREELGELRKRLPKEGTTDGS